MSKDENQYLYVVTHFGEFYYSSSSKDLALNAAEECVRQMLSDFWRHKLPLEVTPQFIRELDVCFYCLNSDSQMAMPVQVWVDTYRQELQDVSEEKAEEEYQRFVALRMKYEERFQRENANAASSVPNCS